MTAEKQAGDADAPWPEATAALARGSPGLVCEWPSLARGSPAQTRGDIVIRGWALAPRGLESVTVEIEGIGAFLARTGLRRPDIHRAFHPAPWSGEPGFVLTVPTAGWLPGVYDVTVSARDHEGGSFAHRGAIEWWPAPQQLSDAYAAGAPALWLDEPRYEPRLPCGETILVRGWARGPAGIARVVVELAGLEPVEAFICIPILESDVEMPANAPSGSAFAVGVESGELVPGRRRLRITASAPDGLEATRSGSVVVDAPARHRALSAATAAESRGAISPGAPPAAGQPEIWTSGGVEGLADALDAFADAADSPALVLRSPADALAPDALARIASAFGVDPAPDLVYADHELLGETGEATGFALKPGWSPELLLGLDYVGSVVALGRGAAAISRAHREPRSVRELLISLADEPLRVVRLPQTLSARKRTVPADATGEDDALRALARRRGHDLELGECDPSSGRRGMRWRVSGEPRVSIVILTTGRGSPLQGCLASIRDRTSYERLEVVLVDSGEDVAEIAAATLGPIDHTTVTFDEDRFNFSRAANLGWRAAGGEYIVFLNDDTRVETQNWLELLIGQCQLPRTGVVGSRLVFGQGLIHSAGLVLDRLWPPPAGHFVTAAYAYRPAASHGHRGMLHVPREVAAVTGACAMVSASLLEELGGWEEGLRKDYGDVDLCLRAHAAGMRVVIEPRAVLIHDGSATHRYGTGDRREDRRFFLDRWRETYGAGDPWYNPRCGFDRDWEL